MSRKKEKTEVEETREMKKTRDISMISQKINHVKNMIEHCLMLYMNKKQTVETLWKEEKIELVLTEIVWQKLQQDNPDFFSVYYVRLHLKEQISVFNILLRKLVHSLGIPRRSVCSRCGTVLFHCWEATHVHCTKCSAIFSVPPQEHAIGHASTSLAAQCMPKNGNPLSAIKYGASSGNANIQIGADNLFPAERMGIPGRIPDHATRRASTSLAAQRMPSNANPHNAIKYGGSSGNQNIQVGAGDLFPIESVGILAQFPDHATRHASTSLAAQYMPSNTNPHSGLKYGGSSGNPNIQVGASDLCPSASSCIPEKITDHATAHASTSLAAQHMPSNASQVEWAFKGSPNIQVGANDCFPAERMGIQGKIQEQATGNASNSLVAQYMQSNADAPGAIEYGGSSGNPNIHVGLDAMFAAGRSCTSTDILGTEISHEVIETADKSEPSFMRNSGSGGDDLLAMHSSTGDAAGDMSGKPSAEIPINADTSSKSSGLQDFDEIFSDFDESFFGLSD